MNAYTWTQGWFNWDGYRHRKSFAAAWISTMLGFTFVLNLLIAMIEKGGDSADILTVVVWGIIIAYAWITSCMLVQRARDMGMSVALTMIIYIVLNIVMFFVTNTGTPIPIALSFVSWGFALVMMFWPSRITERAVPTNINQGAN